MTWQLSIGFFFIFSVTQSLLRRTYAQKTLLPSRLIAGLSYAIGVMPLGIIVGLATQNVTIDWSGITIPVLLLMGLCIGLFNSLAFESSKQLSAATFQTLFQIYPVVVAVGGWLVLNERLTMQQLGGGSLLLTGAVFAAQAHVSKHKTKLLGSAVFLGIAAAASLGVGIVAEKEALDHMSLGAYFIVGYFIQTLATVMIAGRDLSKIKSLHISRIDWLNISALGVLSSLIGFFYIYAIKTADNVGLVSLVTTFQLPLTAIAGYYLLREKEVGWKLNLGILLAFLGLLLTAL